MSLFVLLFCKTTMSREAERPGGVLSVSILDRQNNSNELKMYNSWLISGSPLYWCASFPIRGIITISTLVSADNMCFQYFQHLARSQASISLRHKRGPRPRMGEFTSVNAKKRPTVPETLTAYENCSSILALHGWHPTIVELAAVAFSGCR